MAKYFPIIREKTRDLIGWSIDIGAFRMIPGAHPMDEPRKIQSFVSVIIRPNSLELTDMTGKLPGNHRKDWSKNTDIEQIFAYVQSLLPGGDNKRKGNF